MRKGIALAKCRVVFLRCETGQYDGDGEEGKVYLVCNENSGESSEQTIIYSGKETKKTAVVHVRFS